MLFFAISLFIALVVWLFTNLAKTYTGTISVKVQAISSVEGYSNRSSNQPVVSARCNVDGFRLLNEGRRGNSRTVRVKIDPSDLRHVNGDTWALSGNALNSYIPQIFGEDTQVAGIINESVEFEFVKENHRRVPVEVPLNLVCKDQYMQSGPVKTRPDSVTVYGDDSRLENIDKVLTTRLNLVDISESRHGSLKLVAPKGVRMSVEEVSYEVPVSRYVELSGEYEVQVWNAPAGHEVQVFPPRAKAILRCAFPIVKDPMAGLRVYVDYNDFKVSKSGKCVPKTNILPTGVLDCRLYPEVLDCLEIQ